MTTTGYLVWLIFMAIATMTILTAGTLAAAGLLPRRGSRTSEGSQRTVLAGRSPRMSSDQEPGAFHALALLGAGLLAGTQLSPEHSTVTPGSKELGS
jgi:hypothetical protein